MPPPLASEMSPVAVLAVSVTALLPVISRAAIEPDVCVMLTTPVEGYIACCEALSTLDQRELLPKIRSPTLVIAGRHDMSTTIADGEFMRSRIPGASMTILDAAHISNVEQSHAFTEAVVGFLTQR